MDWKVVARGGRPSPETLEALCRLTGLRRDEVLLSLGREGVVAGTRLSEERAQSLGDSLSRDLGIACRILPDGDRAPREPRFRIILTGFRSGYRSRLRRKLQELTGLPPEQVTLWLSRVPFVLSRNVDSRTAESIRRSVTPAGGIVQVTPEGGKLKDPPDTGGSAVFSLGAKETPTAGSFTNAIAPAARSDGGSQDPESLSGMLPDVEPVEVPTTDDPSVETTPPEQVPLIQGCRIDPPPTGWTVPSGEIIGRPPPVFRTNPPSRTGTQVGSPPGTTTASNAEISPPPPEITFSKPVVMVLTLPSLPGRPEGPGPGPAPEVALLWPPPMCMDPARLLPPVLDAVRHVDHHPEGTGDLPPVIVFQKHGPPGSPVIPAEEAPPDPDGMFISPGIRETSADSASTEPVEEPPVRLLKLVKQSDTDEHVSSDVAAGPPDRTRIRRKRRRVVLMKPPPVNSEPPPDEASLHLYLFAPAPGKERAVTEALAEVLGIPLDAASLLIHDCPAWLAGFRESTRVMGIARELEDRGVTVSIVRGSLLDGGESVRSGPGFQAWLASNG